MGKILTLAAALLLAGAGAVRAQLLITYRLQPEHYGQPAGIPLPRDAAARFILPAGDTLWYANVADSTTAADCIGRVRLRVRVNDDGPITDFTANERGRAALTPGFRLSTPAGETVQIDEVWRRKVACDPGDGFLVIWMRVLAPATPS